MLLLICPLAALGAGSGGNQNPSQILPPPAYRLPWSSVYYIPQLANGSAHPLYITSRISITNLTASEVEAYLLFYTDTGTPWSVPINCLQDGALSGTVASRGMTLSPKASYTFTTPGTGPLSAGWAKIESGAPLLVTAAYTLYRREAVVASTLPSVIGPPPQAQDVPIWTAGVTPAPSGTLMSLNPVIGPDNVMYNVSDNTGIAVANPSDEKITVTAQLFSSGVVLDSKDIALEPRGHKAAYATELFTNIQLNGLLQGTLRLSSNSNFAAMALQTQSGNGADLNGSTNIAPDSDSARNLMYDTEVNDERTSAQRLLSPAEVRGTCVGASGGSDVDYYSVYLAANQTVYVTLLCEAIGSSVNPVLWLENSAGTNMANSTVLNGGRDRQLQFKATTAATYFLRIATTGGTYGKGAFYRMHVAVK